jgi:hypothetical protein
MTSGIFPTIGWVDVALIGIAGMVVSSVVRSVFRRDFF